MNEETLSRPFTLSYQKEEEGESRTASFIECTTLEELLERVNIAVKLSGTLYIQKI